MKSTVVRTEHVGYCSYDQREGTETTCLSSHELNHRWLPLKFAAVS